MATASRGRDSRKTRSAAPGGARERIDATAYDLFCRHGARAVGIDTIIARSGIAKMTLYHHYRSKDELIASFLRRRWDVFATAWAKEVERRGRTPEQRLLAVFDALDAWFREPDFCGCPVLRILLEEKRSRGPVAAGIAQYLGGLKTFLAGLAAEARLRHPGDVAAQWLVLIKGAIIAAYAGDRRAAWRAKDMAALLLDSAKPRARRRR